MLLALQLVLSQLIADPSFLPNRVHGLLRHLRQKALELLLKKPRSNHRRSAASSLVSGNSFVPCRAAITPSSNIVTICERVYVSVAPRA